MANEKHLETLKQDLGVWNYWKMKHPDIIPDLMDANLTKADLSGANLTRANLNGANLGGAHLIRAYLFRANLGRAHLGSALLSEADLRGADLEGANLIEANFTRANLEGADLSSTALKETVFADTNLKDTIGLEECKHIGPSTIDHRTILRSGGLPEVFLRGCGLPDELIDYYPSLLGRAIDYYSCFISYSSNDQDFTNLLHARLQDEGIRTWYAPENLKIGDKFRYSIDDAIRMYDKLLLILSVNSVRSKWVEHEVERALAREHKEDRLKLFPIRLDESVFDIDAGWATDVQTRHIGDFANWKDHDSFQKAFERLLRDLKQTELGSTNQK